jgi:DNA modification methylase
MIRNMAKELKRVLDEGRIACFVCDDTLINGSKFPVVADITKIFFEEGFKYRDKIIWVKPEGYIRISRRRALCFNIHILCTSILITCKKLF